MQRFFATFGTGMEYHGCYVELHAVDHHCARAFMIGAHGERWAELYTEAEFGDQAERYRLHRLAVVRQIAGDVRFDVLRPTPDDQLDDGRVRTRRMRKVVQCLRTTKGMVTAERLASDVGVSHRSIYRYVEDLRVAGFRILSEAGAGYMLMPGRDRRG
ncbi:helix-turn-helix domain-containing protein [Mesorhizobium sp. ANAO-SY3R2]|uniref:helix-turn-helix domain-containing protein n=1 Tax=Mesorhizobium sp. ANAO-SY3R2 TaxID=3166644 RepID=UPI00366FF92C